MKSLWPYPHHQAEGNQLYDVDWNGNFTNITPATPSGGGGLAPSKGYGASRASGGLDGYESH